jgi:CubicO group peptidase (beta-lactamase class C family)
MARNEGIPGPVIGALVGFAAIVWGSPAPLAPANSIAPPAASDSSQAADFRLERRSLEDFVDEFFAAHMASLHVPGASLAFVKDGRQILAKGFGFARLNTRTPVVAEQTLFEVHSVSKLFTVTAVMQAVECGLLRLDDDVNRHLDTFQVPSTFRDPVRVFHLLTHTSGLEDQGVGIAARRESDLLPLKEWMAGSLPPRVSPPGDVLRYSDCGICLAGCVVESAIGQPLARFMEEGILKPLAMRQSYFQNCPPRLEQQRAVGYSFENGAYIGLPRYLSNAWPADGMMTTATDMARFMIAHLQDGKYDAVRILTQESAQAMHRRQFSHHPSLPGVCFDFFERYENNQRVIGHTGAGSGFTSELLLSPRLNVGYFLATNSAQEDLVNAFRESFFDRFFPGRQAAIDSPPPETARNRPSQLTGWYWFNRYDRRTIQKIGSLTGGFIHASQLADGALRVDGRDYREIEPLVYRRTTGDGRSCLAFRKDARGQVAYLFADGLAFERVSSFHSPPFQLGLLALVVLLFLSACVVWPGRTLAHRWRRREAPSQTTLARIAWHWTGITCALNLFVILMIGATLSRVERPSVAAEFQTGLPPALTATIGLATLLVAFSLAVPAFAALAWVKRYWSFSARAYVSLLAMACLAHVWFCSFWNLVAFP